ncbi:MAG: complex I NDUFA9 subunit family protein [Herminiimonas sp.]|nr:complex I NDUFA9 subunit family protein [Herminiimonas sp.]
MTLLPSSETSFRNILVIGGSGFVGGHLIAQLAASGRRVVVPTRRLQRARHLLVLPTVRVVEADVHDEKTLDRLLQGIDAVINLVGVLHSKPGTPYGPAFARAHVELPRKIIAACAARGVSRYLHMSSLGAAADAPSMYQRSKAAGEAAAHAHPEIATTIFRPSVVFGADDKFLNMFASLQKFLPLMLLGGAEAKLQPVFVGDVAQAFVNALDNGATFGKTLELAGPTVYTLRQLVMLAGAYSGHVRPVLGLPLPLARLQAFIFEHLPGEPLLSRDNLDSLKTANVASHPFPPELGIVPQPLESIAPHYLR